MDVISMRDFSKKQILAILDAASDVKKALHDEIFAAEFKSKHGRDVKSLLKNINVYTLFLENSTRTNYSFRAAVLRAGGQVDGFPTKEHTSLKKGETWADTVEMFAGYGTHAIVMRSTTEGLPRWTKEVLTTNQQLMEQQHQYMREAYSYITPLVINGGDGKSQHPTQCLLDLFTMREIVRMKGKDLDGLRLALTNDIAHSRVQASLMSIAHLFNFSLHFAYPEGFGPHNNQKEFLQRRGVIIHDHKQDLTTALRSSEIAVHCRPQKERVGSGEFFERVKKWGMITKELYDQLEDNAPYLMHPKPVDAEEFEEIHHSMRRHLLNWTNVQASNGLYIRIALLALGLGRMITEIDLKKPQKLSTGLYIEKLPLSNKPKLLFQPRSGFIEGEGVVLDHLPPGYGRRLAGILGLEHKQIPKTISDYIPVPSGKGPIKDLIKLHQSYTFSTEQLEAIALLAPNTTISYISNGKVMRKERPVLGDYIRNAITCGNNNCVTQVPKEHVIPLHQIENIGTEKIVRCEYCEMEETVAQVYAANRFRYIHER